VSLADPTIADREFDGPGRGSEPESRDREAVPLPATTIQRRPPRLPNLLIRGLSFLLREVNEFEITRRKSHFRYCGQHVELSSHCSIWGFEGLSIGDHSVVHQYTHIFASGGVTIGRRVMISVNCSISSVTHPVRMMNRQAAPLEFKPVTIGDDVWIGMGAIILPGVTIGDGAVIGAGAVVVRDVPERTVVVGNPGRIVSSF